MLEVKNIHKRFGDNEVLKGVDFKVEKGSVIAVLGNSGSGKTTLLRCISFLERADMGEIQFDDFRKDITAVSKPEIRALRMKMGFVFQGYNLFRNMTALQNVMEGLTTARKIPEAEAKSGPEKCWIKWECLTGKISTRISCPVVSSSVWPSPEPLLTTRR